MNKNVIITGTSRGIGFELVKLFAEAGHNVLALSRNEDLVKKLKLKNVIAFSFDLINENNYKKVENFIKTEWEQVDILINNAGILLNKLLQKLHFKILNAFIKPMYLVLPK